MSFYKSDLNSFHFLLFFAPLILGNDDNASSKLYFDEYSELINEPKKREQQQQPSTVMPITYVTYGN